MNKINKIIFFIFLSLLTVEKSFAEIKDKLFMTIGDKAITASDIVNEIKIILILNNQPYNEEIKDKLHKLAINSIIKRNIKQIEIERNNFFEYNKIDFINELNRLASNINVDLDTLKNICASNELDFKIIQDQVIVELFWNSLIFQLYKDRLKINLEEIDEKLKTNTKIEEYLISEILIPPVDTVDIETEVQNIKTKIENEGFDAVAKKYSISESGANGGNLGWLNVNTISERVKNTILNTTTGNLSKHIVLPEGILIYKVIDKRLVDENLNLEEKKDLLVNTEKQKILQMHSLSHYDKARRSVSIKYFQ